MPDDLLAQALAKMDDDLSWRGPGGRVQAYVLLPRELAEAVRAAIRDIIATRGGRA